MPNNLNLKSFKKNSKNSSKKPTLIIDLRPIQKGSINGVTISSQNFIQDLIDNQNYRIVLWTNLLGKAKFPQKWLDTKDLKYIQTKIPNKILNLILARTNFIKIDKLLKTKADIYFCPDLRPFSLSRKVKSYIYIHDIAYEKYPHFYSLKSRLWYKLISPRKIYHKANTILTNSKFSQKEIQKNYGEKHIRVSKPHLSKNWSKINFEEIKSKSDHAPYLLCISSLQARKNLQNTIKGFELFNKSKKYKLLIVGVKENNFSNIDLKIKQKNKIKFLGQVSENEKKILIKNSKLLLYLPIYEGFGLPILESLNLNTKVLANDLEVFHELYTEHITYCQASESEKIAEKIQEILK